MKTLLGLRTINDYQKVILFSVMAESNILFLCASRSNDLNGYIVEVDANRFKQLWRKTTDPNHIAIANGNILTWIKDRKIPDAERGFAQGEQNPVPLANIECFLSSEGKPYINISNGITRTIYLMAKEVDRFPVECLSLDSAKLLQKFAGFPNSNFKAIEDLIPE